ncbi:hypothetical protein M9H77_03626 [Catharanthus roseus]|uniref:Uncharacterized protein n=1 Tax=Catharanthus roseus TaxID=4058 RepID=A0ACC0CC74_CATRO|nr:hypothetical protein M9H77_03626 [Catharanthus roseus]
MKLSHNRLEVEVEPKNIFSCCLLLVLYDFSSCLIATCLLLYDCELGLLEKERTESESLLLSVSSGFPKYLRFNIPDSRTLKSIRNRGRVKYLLKNLVMHVAISLCI